jgi:hypothetical protein
MKSIADKLATLMPTLLEKGDVYLLALFERDDAPGKWDVIFSSAWSDKEPTPAVRLISKILVPLLSPKELSALSRVVVIPSDQPAVSAMSSGISLEGGCADVVDCNFMGLQIKHAYVLRCKRPPVSKADVAAQIAE